MVAPELIMDGRSASRDNLLVEHVWRSVKYAEVKLRVYGSVSSVRTSLGAYLAFYNASRLNSSLDRNTPDRVYFGQSLFAAA